VTAVSSPPPPFLSVWDRLEAENPEFFEHFNAKLHAMVSALLWVRCIVVHSIDGAY
jgi:hypothetical protein